MKNLLYIILFFFIIPVKADNIKWVLSGIKGGEFHEGRCVVDNGHNKKKHVIDRNNKIIIPAIYDEISDFVDGCAIVSNGINKQGIIDINGKLILPLEYNIEDVSEKTKTLWSPNFVKGLYIVSKGNKMGLFYKSSFIEPLSSDNKIQVYGYPLVQIKQNLFIDIHTLKHYHTTSDSHFNPIVYARSNENEDLIFSGTNKSVPVSSCQTSSTGISIFKDETKNLYGLKDSNGNIILPAEYTSGRQDILTPFWAYDVINLNKKNGDIVVNNKGEIIFRGSVRWIDHFGNIFGTPEGSEHAAVIDQSGGYVIPVDTPISYAYTFYGNYYLVDINDAGCLQLLYHVPSKKFLDVKVPNTATFSMTEDMLQIANGNIIEGNAKLGFLDLKTGAIIKPKYDLIEPFSEGLAKVSNYKSKSETFFINRKGKIVLSEGDKYYFEGSRFTEGVLCKSQASESSKYGFIVNPLGTNYKYAVPSDTPPDSYDIKNWMSKGIELFNRKRYSEAKDYFQKICIIDPSNLSALVNYGACLCNMGFSEEGLESYYMVADMNPNFEDIQQRIVDTKKWIEQKRQQKYATTNNSQSNIKESTPWLILNAIADAMSTVASSMSGQVTNGQQIATQYYDYDIQYSTNTTQKSKSSYQTQYDRWARNAESIYNDITLLGAKVERNNGSYTGSSLQSMGMANYSAMKHNLRTAQSNMRDLRLEAMRNGITIKESKYETATVSW